MFPSIELCGLIRSLINEYFQENQLLLFYLHDCLMFRCSRNLSEPFLSYYQTTKVPTMYFDHNFGLSGVGSNAFNAKSSTYGFVTTTDTCKLIAAPSTCLYLWLHEIDSSLVGPLNRLEGSGIRFDGNSIWRKFAWTRSHWNWLKYHLFILVAA